MSVARARELAVLTVLAAHPAHGYDLARAFGSGPLTLLGLGRAAIYAILDRLQARDWVDMHEQEGGRYPDRRVFALTEAGHAACEDLRRTVAAGAQLPTLPLLALAMSQDTGTPLSPREIAGLVEARRVVIEQARADNDHAESASLRLASAVLEAEIALLNALLDEGAH